MAKEIPREVLEDRLHQIEVSRQKRRAFAVQFGVYLALLVGVIGSQAVEMHNNLSAALKPIELSQVAGSAIVAGALYNKMEGKGDINGKSKNVGRMLRNAIYHGFFWMTVIGAWW
jgi:hypothetical protein